MKLTPEQFNALPESIKKRNPDLFVGAVVGSKPQPNAARALERASKTCQASPCSVIISLIRFGRRNCDSDNLAAAFKGMRDGIATRLGVDDADSRLRWQYGQCETQGETGTLVVIECV